MKKQNEQRLVPKLRFKGFSEDWEQCKLLEVTNRVRDNDGNMSLPTLTISAREGWLDQKDRFSKNIAGNQQKNYTQLKYGQLSYNKGNSKAAPYGVVYMLNTHKEALVPSVYHSFEMIDGVPKFLEYLFSSRKLDRELRKYVSSSARMDGLLNITYQNFEKVELNLPQKYEQLKVKEFLKKLDLLLTLHNKKLELYQKYKQSIKNTILQNKLRLKEDNTPWQSLTIGDIGKTISGTGFPEKEQGGNTGIPFFKVSDMNINDNHKVMQKSTNYVTESQVQQNKWKVIETKNSYIIFAKVGAAIYLERKRLVFNNFLIDNNLMALEIAENFDSEFIYTLINNISFSRFARVGALPSFNSSDIENIRVYIPNKEIQSKYGNLFKKLDQHEVSIDNKVKKLMTFKAYLLEHLFI